MTRKLAALGERERQIVAEAKHMSFVRGVEKRFKEQVARQRRVQARVIGAGGKK